MNESGCLVQNVMILKLIPDKSYRPEAALLDGFNLAEKESDQMQQEKIKR